MGDRTGEQIGNYHLTKLLGAGSFAEVYLGEHVYLGTFAAIKLLNSRISEENDLEIFLKEARIIAGLAHPNIVRVLEFGEHEYIPYLVMDYAPAGTLRNQYSRGSQLSVTQVVTYVRQVASALQYAHDHKIVHCDVKPENMLVGRNGEILLSDFGIAVVSQTSRLHGSLDNVEIGGTIGYMAPEQLQGRANIASDQYALGVVTYEWLTGTLPFNGSFMEIGSQHIFAPPPLVRTKISSISPEIDQVLQTVLAKDPGQRYTNIQAFAHALEDAAGPDSYAQSVYFNENALSAQQKRSTFLPDSRNVSSFLPDSRNASSLHAQPTSMQLPTSQEGSLSSFPAVPLAEPAKRSQKSYFIIMSVLVFLLIGSGLWGFLALHGSSNTVNAHSGTAPTVPPIPASTAIATHAATSASTPGSTPMPEKTAGIAPTHTITSMPAPVPTLAPTPTANIYAQRQPLYRLSAANGIYFYTMSAQERDDAVAQAGYHYDTIAGYMFTTQVANTQPLYRLSAVNGNHYYTMSTQDRDTATAHYGYTYETVAGYLFPS